MEGVMVLKDALRTVWRADARLTALALAMIGLLGVNVVGLLVDPRVITGAPAWLKPAKFAASFAIFTLTMAWAFTYLPDWVKTRKVVSWVTTVTLTLEAVLINLQAWRGTTSHFNIGTPFDAFVFAIMGFAIIVQTFSMIALAAALWRQRFADRAMGWALRLGIVVSIAGAMTGGLMVRPTEAQLEAARSGQRMTIGGAHTVGAPDGGPGIAGTGWSREHGDLRVAHFVGLHAFQLLPLLGIAFVRRRWHDATRVRAVWILSASYVTLFGLLLWQAFRGQSITRPDSAMLAASASWLLVTIGAFASSRIESERTHRGVLSRDRKLNGLVL